MKNSPVVEKYYSTVEFAALVGFSTKWIRRHVAEFEPYGTVVKINGDFRFSAGCINGYLDARRLQNVMREEPGIAARSEGELKRKLRAQRCNSVAS